MLERTPLTELERGIIAKLGTASFPPATASKRFARDLVDGHVRELSDKGRRFLAFVAHRFRRQYRLTDDERVWVEAWRAKEGESMAQHYTKNTVEASAYCKPCGKFTAHRIDGGRLGPCLDCIKRAENPSLPGIVERQPEQLTIAGVYGSIDIG